MDGISPYHGGRWTEKPGILDNCLRPADICGTSEELISRCLGANCPRPHCQGGSAQLQAGAPSLSRTNGTSDDEAMARMDTQACMQSG